MMTSFLRNCGNDLTHSRFFFFFNACERLHHCRCVAVTERERWSNLLLVSVALVHGKMAPLLLGHGEAEHHASKARQKKVAHLTKIRKKEKQGERGQDTYFQSKP